MRGSLASAVHIRRTARSVYLKAFPQIRDDVWSGAGSNRRPSAFQVNRAERCADLRKRTSLTSGTALGGRCKIHASRTQYTRPPGKTATPPESRAEVGVRGPSRTNRACLRHRSRHGVIPPGPSAAPDERGGQDHPVASRHGRRRRGRGRYRFAAGAAVRARSAPVPQAARRTAQAGGAARSVASWPAGLPSMVSAAAHAQVTRPYGRRLADAGCDPRRPDWMTCSKMICADCPEWQPRRLVAGQSWRVNMTTGICRVVLAWNSPRAGVSATSFGHSSARAAWPSSSANTVNV